MKTEEAKKILEGIGATISNERIKKGCQENSCISYTIGNHYAFLEGRFMADELEALACVMRQKKRQGRPYED